MVERTKREEEEKYFQAEDQEKMLDLRRKKQLDAVRRREREGIATVLSTSEEVAEEAMNLGFDAETVRVLPLITIIQVAWADGRVTGNEHDEVEEIASRYGIQGESSAHHFLMMLLKERPTDLFFDRVNNVIAHLLEDSPHADLRENLLEWSRDVAEASGGLFGLLNPISKKEQAVLEEFIRLFRL